MGFMGVGGSNPLAATSKIKGLAETPILFLLATIRLANDFCSFPKGVLPESWQKIGLLFRASPKMPSTNLCSFLFVMAQKPLRLQRAHEVFCQQVEFNFPNWWFFTPAIRSKIILFFHHSGNSSIETA
jgi:hypothetical protein